MPAPTPAALPADGASRGEDLDAALQQSLVLLPHRRRLHAALLEALDLRRRDVSAMSDRMLRAQAEQRLVELVGQDGELPEGIDRAQLCRAVLDEAVGLGPLEPLLADGGISEIMANRHDEIYVERAVRGQGGRRRRGHATGAACADADQARADHDLVVGQHRRMGGHAQAIDAGTAKRAQILQHDGAVQARQARMHPAHSPVGDA
ncbi:hypothetical protein L549_1647 [Bordetella pertussis H939]|nr:hypothetical protein L549_1647 [Bordetella pertussis H939]